MPDSNSQSEQEFAAQFLDEYYAECDEHLTLVRRNLLALEESLANQKTFDRDKHTSRFPRWRALGCASQLWPDWNLLSRLKELGGVIQTTPRISPEGDIAFVFPRRHDQQACSG